MKNILKTVSYITFAFILSAGLAFAAINIVPNGGTGVGTLTGLAKGNGTSAFTAATAGTDYQAPITLTTTGTSGAATFTSNTLNIPQYSGGGAVSSVSNSDGSLTISPTTGNVISSINVAHPQEWTGLQTFSSNLKIDADGNASNAFAMGGRPGVGIPVPYFQPTQANQNIALDVFPKGTPGNGFGNSDYGVAWEDICSTDVLAVGDYECLHLGKSDGGYANVSTSQGGTGVIRPLELQAFGGPVGINTNNPGGIFQVGDQSGGNLVFTQNGGSTGELQLYYLNESVPRLAFGRDMLGSGNDGFILKPSSTGTIANTGSGFGSSAAGVLDLYTSNGTALTKRLTINSSGVVNITNLSTNGLVKTSGGTGTLSIATAGTDYLSSVNINTSLTGAGTTASALGINLGHANVWTASQQFTLIGINKAVSSTIGADIYVDNSVVTQGVRIEGSSALVSGIGTFVTGDLNLRWAIRADGRMVFGDGTAGADTNLYRTGVATLNTDGAFTVGTSLSINGGTALTTTNRTGTGNLVLATSPTITSPVITNIAPAANFTITQNSVAPFTSINSGAIANTLNLNAGMVGILTAAPTHTLTLGSTNTGIVSYNTSDQTTNYERVRMNWGSNIFTIQTENGGTGVARSLDFNGGAGTHLTMTSTGVQILRNSTSAAQLLEVTSTGLTSSSTIQNGLLVDPVINQTLTGGYNAIYANVTETAIGSGAKNLLNLAVGGSSKLTVSNSGVVTTVGNLFLSFPGNKLNIATGSNASVGTGTLSGGTVTISTTAVGTSSLIFLTDTGGNSLTNVGSLAVGTITNGTSFVVKSTNVLDTSTFNWFIVN